MARYTSLFRIAVPFDRMLQLLTDSLQTCRLDVVYSTNDYLLARETPGGVSFSKLVTVEVLIDRSIKTDSEVQMNLVVKNEELPLKSNNHCWQMFNQVNQAVAENHQWQLLESAAS